LGYLGKLLRDFITATGVWELEFVGGSGLRNRLFRESERVLNLIHTPGKGEVASTLQSIFDLPRKERRCPCRNDSWTQTEKEE
jgi:hypothetical protein